VFRTCGDETFRWPPYFTAPVVDANRAVHLLLRGVSVTGGCYEGQPTSLTEWLKHLRVDPNGAPTWTTLADHSHFGISIDYEERVPEAVVPDSLDGVLAVTRYHPSATTVQTPPDQWDVQVHRVTATGAEARVVPPGSSITLTGDAGTAFVTPGGGEATYAVDVTTWAPLWTAPVTGTPVMAIAGGGVAVHNVATGTLSVVDGDGVLRSTSPLPLTDAYQALRAGEWIGSDANGMLAAVTAPFVVDASGSLMVQEGMFASSQAGGSARRQGGPKTGYADREQAALAAMDHIYSAATFSDAEFGGLICQRGGEFVWSRFVTQMVQDEVLITDDLCGPRHSIAARYHVHPPMESPEPSGPDVSVPNGTFWRFLPFYLQAPSVEGLRFNVYKYWSRLPPDQEAHEANPLHARHNICVRHTDGSWWLWNSTQGSCDTLLP
jgi:hypothetical protein